jgi:uncharacterized protein YqgC (DUF456 family)
MSPILAALVLGACSVAGLVLVALGLPGLWLIVAAVCVLAVLPGFHAFGWGTIVIVLALAFAGELVELWMGYGLARRYGGSKRSGWGAVVGGLAGALVGVPIPIVGSVIGSLVGAFIGAALFEYTLAPEGALRAGWGALVGRIVATSAKMAMGIVMAVVAIFSALRG